MLLSLTFPSNRSDLETDRENETETAEQRPAAADESCDEDVYISGTAQRYLKWTIISKVNLCFVSSKQWKELKITFKRPSHFRVEQFVIKLHKVRISCRT